MNMTTLNPANLAACTCSAIGRPDLAQHADTCGIHTAARALCDGVDEASQDVRQLVTDVDALSAGALPVAAAAQAYCWMVAGMSTPFYGEYAEHDAKAEAKRIGGTAKAFPLFREEPAASAHPYPSGDSGQVAGGEDARYRLLDEGDTIQADDEFVGDDGTSWVHSGALFVGMRYINWLKTGRRRIEARAQQDGGDRG
jgi:hypothetical protein